MRLIVLQYIYPLKMVNLNVCKLNIEYNIVIINSSFVAGSILQLWTNAFKK